MFFSPNFQCEKCSYASNIILMGGKYDARFSTVIVPALKNVPSFLLSILRTLLIHKTEFQ